MKPHILNHQWLQEPQNFVVQEVSSMLFLRSLPLNPDNAEFFLLDTYHPLEVEMAFLFW